MAEEIKNTEEIITIRKEKFEKGEQKFDTYVFNKDGNAVKLSFRQEGNNVNVIPYGISKVKVKDLSESKKSFYPKYFATFIEVVKHN